ncbi:MAG: hypothetical protein M0R06_07310 [Sphaerochaeta sp.]|jgi:hypothetical protein|nr:hypothetical protein [Sphaerochaeta sp.]
MVMTAFDWKFHAIREGKGFHIDIGALSTGITGGGAGTVVDLDQPEGIISVAAGYVLVPLRIQVNCHMPLLATDADECEILIAVDRAAAYAGDGTVTTETAVNMKTGASATSNATCASAATADITDPTLGMELARKVITGDVQGTPATAIWTPLEVLYEPACPPILVGPCAIYIYWGGTVAVTGFAQVEWLEYTDL